LIRRKVSTLGKTELDRGKWRSVGLRSVEVIWFTEEQAYG
jgi:hypothetical protein